MRVSQDAPIRASQNFLTSRRTIGRLLRLTTISAADHVVEIGPGKGHITGPLLDACGHVTAVETDGRLCDILKEKFCARKNLALFNADFLAWPLPAAKYKVFANIPFCRTTEILRKLADSRNPPGEAWLVMEKGAAKRFMGCPDDTIASIFIKPFFETKIEYYFERQDFHPMPSVDTVLLHFAQKTQPDIPLSKQKDFMRFVEKGLRHGIESQLTKKQISTALKLAKLPCIEQSGLLSYVQWLCLFRCHCKFHR